MHVHLPSIRKSKIAEAQWGERAVARSSSGQHEQEQLARLLREIRLSAGVQRVKTTFGRCSGLGLSAYGTAAVTSAGTGRGG